MSASSAVLAKFLFDSTGHITVSTPRFVVSREAQSCFKHSIFGFNEPRHRVSASAPQLLFLTALYKRSSARQLDSACPSSPSSTMAELVGLVTSILQLVATAKLTIGVGIDAVNSPEQQRDVLAEIEGLEPLLTDLQARLQGNPSVNGMRQLDRLRSSNKSKLRKALAWALWKKKEAEEDLDKLERFKALLNSWLIMDIWDASQQQQGNHDEMLKAVTDAAKGHDDILNKVAHDQHQGHDNILNEVKDAAHDQKQFIRLCGAEREHAEAERDTIISWLSPLNFFSRNQDIYRARQEGTGLWLLDHVRFKGWVSSTGGTLWCYGMPGAGKTVLSSVITEFLRAQFTTGNIGVRMLSGGQLIFRKPLHSGSLAHTLYDMHYEKRTSPTLEEMHTLLRSAVAEYSKVYFIIDALDEYPEIQRHSLLKHLTTFGAEVNLLLTSRPHIKPDIFFPNTPSLEVQAAEEDIRRYIDAQIQNSPRLSNHVQSCPELHQEIETKIISRMDGIAKRTKLLPSQFSHGWTNAKRPLSVAELLEAIAIEPGTKSLDREVVVEMPVVLSVCAGLIIVDQDSTVRLIHYTTQGYLDSVQASKFPLAQTEIAQGCLTYLLYDDFVHLPKGRHKLWALQGKHALLEYSFQHGLIHAAGEPEAMLQHLILDFLGQASRWDYFWNVIRYNRGHASSPWEFLRSFYGQLQFRTKLHFAALFNLQETVQNILALDPDLWDQKKDELLLVSSSFGYVGMVELLLKKGVDVNVLDGKYGNILNAASYHGKEEIVQLLIERGANVNAQVGEYGNALQTAAYHGKNEVVRLLIEKGANVNGLGGKYGSALQAASTTSNTVIIQLLIEKGANVNVQGGKHGNPLQAASVGGDETVVQLLLDKGANVNAHGGEYGSALQAASTNPNTTIVQLLIDQGADVNNQGGMYGNALQAASYVGNEAVVRLLIEKGANMNAQSTQFGNALQMASKGGGGEHGSALQAASYAGNEAVVQLLVDKGANVNAQGGEHGNALQAASVQGNKAVVRLLIDTGSIKAGDDSVVWLLIKKGANVNAQGGKYGHALQAASTQPVTFTVQLLIDHGADLNAQGGMYGNALLAATWCRHERIVKLLRENGADVNARGADHRNVLLAAVEVGDKAVVQQLLENGVDVNLLDRNLKYGNALQVASAKGNTELIKLLIEEGANVDALGGKYGNTLQVASWWGHEEVVKLLIEKGANINAQGGVTGNALHAASVRGHKTVVQLLIDKGADVDAQDGVQGTALQAASYFGNKEVVRLLIERGADLNAPDGRYGTALEAAVIQKHQAVVRLLIKKGTNKRPRRETGDIQ
ncbi:ankyrin repeat-containing domain protein [Mycena rebaudengoi]|nr:ankyrin repeat-containing domain protein [Mycena rebaudengoi]